MFSFLFTSDTVEMVAQCMVEGNKCMVRDHKLDLTQADLSMWPPNWEYACESIIKPPLQAVCLGCVSDNKTSEKPFWIPLFLFQDREEEKKGKERVPPANFLPKMTSVGIMNVWAGPARLVEPFVQFQKKPFFCS